MTDPTSSESQPIQGIARREQRLFFLVDCSASMSLDGKMDTLNHTMEKAIGAIRNTPIHAGVSFVDLLLQVLKFSHGASWTTPEPVPVSSFQWQPMQADELDRTDPGWAREMRQQLVAADPHGGKFKIGLQWFDRNDLELSVICPHGNEVSVRNRELNCCGGWMDVSMNECGDTEQPIEHIVFGHWPDGADTELAPGTYTVVVTFNKQHARKSSSDFRVLVDFDDHPYSNYEGTVSTRTKTKIMDTITVTDGGSLAGAGGTGTGGNTDLGAALTCLGDALKSPPLPRRALSPLVVLLSDGRPTDEYEAALAALDLLPRWKQVQPFAIAIGQDADREVLTKFTPFRVLDSSEVEGFVGAICDPWDSALPPKIWRYTMTSEEFEESEELNYRFPPPPPPLTPAFDFAKCWQEAWSSSDEENEQRYREYAEGRWEEDSDVAW